MFGLFRRKDPLKQRSDATRAALAARGDDGTRPAPVEHRFAAEGGGAVNATVLKDYLVASGLETRQTAEDRILAVETREVASEAFDARVAALARAVEGWRWRHDGWDRPGANETGESR